MMQGLDSYDSSQKAHWRGWQWNRIVERLPEFAARKNFDVKRMSNLDRRVCRDKTVLYLCGPDDIDFAHATRLGFDRHNMIAVDIEQENVDKARRFGAVAVAERLESVVYHWPADWHIDVIVADLCCGFTLTALSVIQSTIAAKATSENTVVAFNLMRGRDAVSKEAREAGGENKHRGRAVAVQAMYAVAVACTSELASNASAFMCSKWMRPAQCSYRGSKVTMDSVVFRRPNFPTLVHANAAMPMLDKWRSDTLSRRGITEDVTSVKNKLRALRAVRTMRGSV